MSKIQEFYKFEIKNKRIDSYIFLPDNKILFSVKRDPYFYIQDFSKKVLPEKEKDDNVNINNVTLIENIKKLSYPKSLIENIPEYYNENYTMKKFMVYFDEKKILCFVLDSVIYIYDMKTETIIHQKKG